jgi:hypothetical protein
VISCLFGVGQFIPIGLMVIIFSPSRFSSCWPRLWWKESSWLADHHRGFAFSGLVVAIGPSFGDLDMRGIGSQRFRPARGVVQFSPVAPSRVSHACRVRQPGASSSGPQPCCALYVGNGTCK